MANYHRSAVATSQRICPLRGKQMDRDRNTTRKAGPNNGTKSFTASSERWGRKKRQLKRKFFLFITLKILPEHIKFLLWNSSLRVPLIPPIIIFLCVPFVLLEHSKAKCVLSETRQHKTFTSSQVLWHFVLNGSLASVAFFCHFYS